MRSLYTHLLLLAVLFLAIPPALAEVYKVIDPVTGKVTYTDRPPPEDGTVRNIDLPELNTQRPVELPAADEAGAQDADGDGKVPYERVTIESPANETTIPPGQVEVRVRVGIEPGLQEDDRVRVLFNGKPVGRASPGLEVTIGNLNRGTHQIKAQVVDDQGNVLAESNSVTVYVKRATRLIIPG